MSVNKNSFISTPPSILKRPSSRYSVNGAVQRTPSRVYYVLPYTKSVKCILNDFLDKTNIREYENLVYSLRECEITDDDLLTLLREANSVISLLGKGLQQFIISLLHIKWLCRPQHVISAYKRFLINIVSAHSYHANLVVDHLIQLFLPGINTSELKSFEMEVELQNCAHVHSVLSTLLQISPMCDALIMQALKTFFPYKKKPTYVHVFFLNNLLHAWQYMHNLRRCIFMLIISKMVTMDVSTPREEILLENGGAENMSVDEYDTKSMKSFCSSLADTMFSTSTASTLDAFMVRMMDFLEEQCMGYAHEDEDHRCIQSRHIFQEFVHAFDQIILPTHNTHHVQFLALHLCSLNPRMYAEVFLDYLWKKITNPEIESELRKSAVNYIISLLARANYIRLSILKYYIEQISNWIHSYIATQDGLECINSDVRIHTVFYTVCQGLFYLISYRHRTLVKKKKNILFLANLNLTKMVTCRLNPLRLCHPIILQHFAAVTRKYQFAYCYTIMEHNRRDKLPLIYHNEREASLVGDFVLSGSYPFDVYVLEESGVRIHANLRHQQEDSLLSAEAFHSSHSSNADNNNFDIDDFLNGE